MFYVIIVMQKKHQKNVCYTPVLIFLPWLSFSRLVSGGWCYQNMVNCFWVRTIDKVTRCHVLDFAGKLWNNLRIFTISTNACSVIAEEG